MCLIGRFAQLQVVTIRTSGEFRRNDCLSPDKPAKTIDSETASRRVHFAVSVVGVDESIDGRDGLDSSDDGDNLNNPTNNTTNAGRSERQLLCGRKQRTTGLKWTHNKDRNQSLV